MTLKEIFVSGGSAVLILMTLVQVSPIKVNPWSWLAKAFGKAINADMIEKQAQAQKEMEAIRAEVSAVKDEMSEQKADGARTRILRFGDEIRMGLKHSKEHFDQTLRDLAYYERYCAEHPDYENNVTRMTGEIIAESYQKRLKNNDFL